MSKKCIVCCLLVFSIVFSVLIFSSCTSSKSKPETITLNAVYDSTEIILDEKFTSIFDFKFYDNIYLCGQIDDFVAFASINASDISYLTTDVPAPAIGFCKTNDAYIVITSLLKPNSEYVSYILHLVSEQGITLSVFEIPAIINENEEFHTFTLDETICVVDSEKCISLNLTIGAWDTLFYFDSYGIFQDLSYSNSNVLFSFKNLYGETVCYRLDETLSLKTTSFANSNILNTSKFIFTANNSTFYICNSQGIYNTSQKDQLLLSWANSCIDFENINDIIFIDASTLYILYRAATNKPVSLFLLKPAAESATQERIIIRVSYYESGSKTIPQAAIQFNSCSDKYYILLDEKATVFTESYDQSVSMLSSFEKDILSNKVGDVIVLNTDYREYADKEIFCNLYDFLSSDTSIQKDDIFKCVLKSLEYNNNLFIITPCFRIKTLVTKSSDIFPSSWNCSEFISLSSSLKAPRQLLSNMNQDNLMDILCKYGISSFIDLKTSSCDFTNSYFKDILDFLYELPYETAPSYSFSDCSPYQDGTYLLYYATICNIADYLSLKVRFGYDNSLTFLGLPSNQGGVSHIEHGDYYAISENSAVKEGAWEFIKFILINYSSNSYIPALNTTPFDKWCSQQQNYSYLFDTGATYTAIDLQTNLSPKSINLTQELIDEFVSMLNSTQSIQPLPAQVSEIIEEELSLFLSGQNSAEKTVNYIQNRVSIYLSEKE